MEIEYKNIDPKLVVNEIRNGRSLESVQKLFGLRFKTEVQDLYLRGLMELGEIPEMGFNRKEKAASTAPASLPQEVSPPPLPSRDHATMRQSSIRRRESTHRPTVVRRPKAKSKPSVLIKTNSQRTIGQSGSITLNKALLIDQLDFHVGDSFQIFREDDRIVLQKIHGTP